MKVECDRGATSTKSEVLVGGRGGGRRRGGGELPPQNGERRRKKVGVGVSDAEFISGGGKKRKEARLLESRVRVEALREKSKKRGENANKTFGK